MFGRLIVSGRRGLLPRRARLFQERICGVTFIRADVFLPDLRREDACRRAVEKAARRMKKLGAFCVVPPPGLFFEGALRRGGVTTVSPVGLCRAMAAPMALFALAEERVEPGKAAAALVASRVTAAVERAAVHLSLRVRYLYVEIPSGGGALCRQLRRDYGVAAQEGLLGARADVTVLFAPLGEGSLPAGGPVLYLDDGQPPHLPGRRIVTGARFRLGSDRALLPGSDETQLLSALYECRAVSPDEIEILELDTGRQTEYNSTLYMEQPCKILPV